MIWLEYGIDQLFWDIEYHGNHWLFNIPMIPMMAKSGIVEYHGDVDLVSENWGSNGDLRVAARLTSMIPTAVGSTKRHKAPKRK